MARTFTASQLLEFTHGTAWECSSGPIVPRMFEFQDLWPHGAGGSLGGEDMDVLEDGLHPVLAIGPRTNRPHNLTGVVITVTGKLATLNMADKVCVKQNVANVLTYGGDGEPATWDGVMNVGDPVYVDDSDALGSGTTLSRSPKNASGDYNPLAGYLFYCQDEYHDEDVGGPNTGSVWPKVISASETVEDEYCVLLVNDSGRPS